MDISGLTAGISSYDGEPAAAKVLPSPHLAGENHPSTALGVALWSPPCTHTSPAALAEPPDGPKLPRGYPPKRTPSTPGSLDRVTTRICLTMRPQPLSQQQPGANRKVKALYLHLHLCFRSIRKNQPEAESRAKMKPQLVQAVI